MLEVATFKQLYVMVGLTLMDMEPIVWCVYCYLAPYSLSVPVYATGKLSLEGMDQSSSAHSQDDNSSGSSRSCSSNNSSRCNQWRSKQAVVDYRRANRCAGM